MPTYQGQFVPGQVLNAADLNAFTPYGSYQSSGNQLIPNVAFTNLNFAVYSGGSAPAGWVGAGSGRITPSIAGYYLVTANVQMASSTGARSHISLVKNTVTTIASNDILSAVVGQGITAVMFFNGTTDFVSTTVYQQSGAALNYTNYQLTVAMLWQ
jgi:hypothetical protein